MLPVFLSESEDDDVGVVIPLVEWDFDKSVWDTRSFVAGALTDVWFFLVDCFEAVKDNERSGLVMTVTDGVCFLAATGPLPITVAFVCANILPKNGNNLVEVNSLNVRMMVVSTAS